MNVIMGVDPATRTGLVLVSDTGAYLGHTIVDFPAFLRREKWLEHASAAAKSLLGQAAPAAAKVTWVIEDWARHLSYDAAVKMAHVQQAWVDAAGLYRDSVVLIEVTGWQADAGVTKASRRAGKGKEYQDARRTAGKAAAAIYARAALTSVPSGLTDDVTDALAMVAVHLTRTRLKALTPQPEAPATKKPRSRRKKATK